ncbi:hypothetical protein [Belliella pelovolcani]|uniref:Heavy-metal-associated domain-containing protein n=1 Tax=Belliella pelovolcani TaxID=529505 RepID=A0A1N7NWT2_9BACT|nr:hypothetical protein [Belliella pelovolcani]SIT02669.1 hypothetical protein SAMN05421761_11232 [Belliella pelovolcani]
MKSQNPIISVYATSVTKRKASELIINEIGLIDGVLSCNFDLEDCDKILRVVSKIDISEVIRELLISKGFKCVELMD